LGREQAVKDKKLQIIKAAIKLFGERDYYTTPVQDIASLAGMSKGAFYQHFQSKEELLLSIYSYYFNRLQDQLDEAQNSQSLSPKELILRAVQLNCDLVMGDKDFLNMMMKGTGFTDNQTLLEFITRKSMDQVRWIQERIKELYGPEVEPHSLDCSVMLNGLMKEYFFLCIFCNQTIDAVKLSHHLFERLDDLVTGITRKQANPILPSTLLEPVVQHTEKAQQLTDTIVSLRGSIQALAGSGPLTDTMLQSLDAIVAEQAKEQSNPIIIHGMQSYLLGLAKENEPLLQKFQQFFQLP
jgi:AcrR family transcriptional regulator